MKMGVYFSYPQSAADLCVSVSQTTRPGEVDGQEYHFVSKEDFECMVSEGEFIEHARVFNNYYGTSSAAVDKALSGGSENFSLWRTSRSVSCLRSGLLKPR